MKFLATPLDIRLTYQQPHVQHHAHGTMTISIIVTTVAAILHTIKVIDTNIRRKQRQHAKLSTI